MAGFGNARRGRVARFAAVLTAVALVVAACGDDDDDATAGTGAVTDTSADDGATTPSQGTAEGTADTDGSGPLGDGEAAAVPTGELGPEDVASGDPIKIGYFNDGTTAAVDHGDDTIVAEAITDYWNAHQGGIGGSPIELVYCSTDSDPAIATDCGNRFVEEEVVAVASGTSGYSGQVYAPVHAAGIPLIEASVALPEMANSDLTYILNNQVAGFGFPLAVAREAGVDSVVTLIIDVPAATDPPRQLMPPMAEADGIEWSDVAIPGGTPDMLPQITASLQDDPGVVHLIGDPAFCLVALRGLYDAGYEGIIVTADYCVDAEVFEPLPVDQLQELKIFATVAMDNAGDPDWDLYTAIMDEYASDEPEVSGVRGWTYQTLFSLYWALTDVDAASLDPAGAAAAIEALPESHQPLGAGITYRCDGTKFPISPAYCTNALLETHLDGERRFDGYSPVDVGPELAALAAALGG